MIRLKEMNLFRIKKSETPRTLLAACMSSKSKSTNHYDTLNISQSATQEEIKSAYYQLSKQYHPDMNDSEEAKEKFRDVSDAYEVLGNYSNRRQYDRGMISRGMAEKPQRRNEAEDRHAAFYRSRMASHPRPIVTANMKIFDFDAWTRAHYGTTFDKTLKRKQFNQGVEIKKEKRAEEERLSSNDFIYIVITVTLVFFAVATTTRSYDVPLEQNKDQEKR